MTAVLYGIPNCDSVKRAQAWLHEKGTAFTLHDFKNQGVSAHRLDAWIAALGWEPLLNRKGTTWRRLDEALRAGVVDGRSARAVMLQYPSVIKRPVIEWPGGAVSAGFDPARWPAS